MLSADDASAYSRVHETFHPPLRRIDSTFGFVGHLSHRHRDGADRLLDGQANPDFATRLSDGPYAHSHFGRSVPARAARAGSRRGRGRRLPALPAVVGRSARVPRRTGVRRRPRHRGAGTATVRGSHQPRDDGRPAMGTRRARQNRRGVSGRSRLPDALGLALPARIARSCTRSSLRKTEYAGRRRSQRSCGDNSSILYQKVRSFAAEQALQGNEGTGVITDYRGVEVLGSWAPLHIAGLEWGIVAKIDRDEAYMPMQHIARDTLIQTLVILLVITMVVMFLATSFVRPVNDLIARVQLARTGKTDMTFATEIERRNRRPRALVPRTDRRRAEADAPARGSDHARISSLLENVMPKGMAQRVRLGQGEITERDRRRHGRVRRTERARRIHARRHPTASRSTVLKRLITAFDEAALRHGVERIKTVGDTYLAVTGLLAAAARPHAPHRRVRTCGARDRRATSTARKRRTSV